MILCFVVVVFLMVEVICGLLLMWWLKVDGLFVLVMFLRLDVVRLMLVVSMCFLGGLI